MNLKWMAHGTINRTIMELKLRGNSCRCRLFSFYQSNHHGIETHFHEGHTFALYVYQSNHHGIETKKALRYVFEQIDYQSNHHGIETVDAIMDESKYSTINRTIMELKRAKYLYCETAVRGYQSNHHGIETTQLKRIKVFKKLSIEPSWN